MLYHLPVLSLAALNGLTSASNEDLHPRVHLDEETPSEAFNLLDLLRAKAREAIEQGHSHRVEGVDWTSAISVSEAMVKRTEPRTLAECGIVQGARISVVGVGNDLPVSRDRRGRLFISNPSRAMHDMSARRSEVVITLDGILDREIMADRPRLVHADQRCTEDIWIRSQSLYHRVLQGLMRRSDSVPEYEVWPVVSYLYWAQHIHATGLLMNTEGMAYASEQGKFDFWLGDQPWRMFVDPGTRAHSNPSDCESLDTCRTRARDFLLLIPLLKRVQAGSFRPTWEGVVAEFERYVLTELGWYDEPDYTRWFQALARAVSGSTLGEYFKYLLENPAKREAEWFPITPEWIQASLIRDAAPTVKASPEEIWELLKGRESMELLKLVDGENNRGLLMYIAAITQRAIDFAGAVETGLLFHRKFGEWKSDLCARKSNLILSLFESCRPFIWLICPAQWMRQKSECLLMDLEKSESVGGKVQLVSGEDVAEVWKQLNLRELDDRVQISRQIGYSFKITSNLLYQLQLPVD